MTLLRPRRPPRRHSIMTTARWETPYLAEWLAYHQALGFDHVYLYCNDDDPGDLYTEAVPWTSGPNPFVTFVHCPHQGQQWWMFLHFMQTFMAETEWVLFIDLDEFLSLRRDRTISDFMKRQAGDTDCIYFYWTFFGHSGFAERPPGSVLRQYTRRQPGVNSWTKAITRTSAIDPARMKPEFRGFITHPHHGWDHELSTPGLRSKDVLGADMHGYWPDNEAAFARIFAGDREERMRRVMEEAVLHHYAIRSEADFQRRVARGLSGDFGAQASWGRREAEGGAAEFLASLDVVEDRTLADWWEAWLRSRTAGLGMYGPPPPAPLLSRGKPTLQSSGWSPDGSPVDLAAQSAGAVDGRALTGRYAFHTDVEDAPWFELDLGAPSRIAEVRLYNRMDMAEVMDRTAWIGISVSQDGERWRSVHQKRNGKIFGGADGRPLTWRPGKPVEARWVRVELLRRGILHLEQVEVFGWTH